ncbi:MAG: [protein-PII] uridylyltransferase [Deltaproteobacteria bacterium]|nr:[protein-PII] uridylyltransferase [Deltaproteobacteria bacterium]
MSYNQHPITDSQIDSFPPKLVLEGNNILPSVKDYLKKGEEILHLMHIEGKSGHEIVCNYTLLIDTLLKTLYTFIETEIGGTAYPCKNNCTLVALGGYGREELNIRSDIDLMLLYPKKLLPFTEKLAERLLYILWDTGLDTGFSVRSLKECINLAKDDIKTKTAVLDARHLNGNTALFCEFLERLKKNVFNEKGASAFIKEKIEEGAIRKARYGGSVYLLEPNVKEGEGGLRDLHTALWVAKAKYGVADIAGLTNNSILSTEEFSQLYESTDFLWRVRNELHFESNRKLDQLTFDHQTRIAKVFGFEDTKTSLGVEKFMQKYYLHASNINHFSSLIISRCLNGCSTDITGYVCEMEKEIDGDFRLCSNLLCVKDANLFQEKPYKILKAFELTCLYNMNMDNMTKELLLKNLNLIDSSFMASMQARQSFINILKSGRAYNALQEMHRLRFLGKLMPAFEEITCKVQHDMYHIYTIDTHSLFAVRELERLRAAEYKMEFFLLATIYEEVSRPELLTLGVLLHDIGKAKGRGHAEKGAEMIGSILGGMGFSEEDIELVAFLVKHHLILPDTAQGRDIHDEKLVINFAKTVGSIERLNLLYLLTFADVRAVGPEVWTQWKAALFQELYFKAMTVIERGEFEPESAVKRIPKIRDAVVTILTDEIDRTAVENYFQLLPHRYFLSNSPDVIAGHIRFVEGLGEQLFTINIKHSTERHYTDVTICTLDMHGLFSKITGVMSANNINILGAQINTLKNGIVLDVLQVASPMGEIITDEAKWQKTKKDLADALTGAVYVDKLVAKIGTSILDKKPKPVVPAFVEIDNDVSDEFTVIDIHAQDRVGLLYSITSAMAKLGLYIYVSKITTKGNTASDIFYVKDIFGQKIYYSEKLKDIKETLLKAV